MGGELSQVCLRRSGGSMSQKKWKKKPKSFYRFVKLNNSPCSRIVVAGVKVLDISMDDRWKITQVELESGKEAKDIGEIIVTIKKRAK